MRKRILAVAAILLALSSLMVSCSKDDLGVRGVKLVGRWSMSKDRLYYIDIDENGYISQYFLEIKVKGGYTYDPRTFGFDTPIVTYDNGTLHIATKGVVRNKYTDYKVGTEITFDPIWLDITSDDPENISQIRNGMLFWGPTVKLGDVRKVNSDKIELPPAGNQAPVAYERIKDIVIDK